MNKYENPEFNNNRAHVNQLNYTNVTYNQNDTYNFPRPFCVSGNINIANQQISMPQQMPGQIQNFYQNYSPIMQQNCYQIPNNQIYPQCLGNVYQVSNNYIRQNGVQYNQPQSSNFYHSQVDKAPANHPNYICSQSYNVNFQSQYPVSQHMGHNLQQPLSHHMQHIQPSIQQQQMPLSFNPMALRTCLPNVNEKHAKTNSALEIINPETNTSIDLKSFKNDVKSNKDNQNEKKGLKIENIEYSELYNQPNKSLPSYVNINTYENIKTETTEYEELQEIDKTDVLEEQIDTEYCEISTNKIEYLSESPDSHHIDKDNGLESNDKLELNSPDEIVHHYQHFQSANEPLLSEQQQIVIKKTPLDLLFDGLQATEINNVPVNSASLVQDNEIPVDNGHSTKYIYSRDELIKIGKSVHCRRKPKGLPDKEEFTDNIILDNSNMFGIGTIDSMHQISPKNKTNRNCQGNNNWRQFNIKNIQGFPKYINLGITESALSRSDDGYVTCKQRLAAGEELSETEELIRQIKGILNRIVPQNFDKCLDDLVLLKIGTHEGMTCLVNELFQKAVKEEAYSVTFAKICSYLASIKADVSDSAIVTFKSVLLQKCQAMFTTPLEEQLNKVREDWLLKASQEKPKIKALMESDVDEQIKKAKDRYYGNIRFIGELYLKGVLITKIICYCIENLLTKENDPDSLICLCKLLETCGSKLETEHKGKEKLNESFKKLRQLSESLFIETRVRFRILDIMEMRQKKWCLRKVQQEQKIQPKTLEEIKIEKEKEEEKDHYSSLTRKPANNWTSDRRPSLPNNVKNRSNFTPRQLTVARSSNDPTTLCPQNRNWINGSGSTINTHSVDNTDRRITKHKNKLSSEISPKDSGTENTDPLLTQPVDSCDSSYQGFSLSPPQSFNTLHYGSANSSENSSRSSSHGRSTPQTSFKEKLPDSKLAQSGPLDTALSISPNELLREYTKKSVLCKFSWNAYPDKVEVVYQWLDSNFDTDCSNRMCLSNLLSMLINQSLMRQCDLLKAFSKVIDSLEELIIDIGQEIWDSLSDYFIPFLESMEIDSLDLIEKIFDFETLSKFQDKKFSYIIYSMPWSMTNSILKSKNAENFRDIFKIALKNDNVESLSQSEQNLISIISKNLSRAINTVIQVDVHSYINWIEMQNYESFNCYAEEFFILLNWEEMFLKIRSNSYTATKLSEGFVKISSISKHDEVLTCLCKMSENDTNPTCKAILAVLRCLILTKTYDIDTILSWELKSQTICFPPKLKTALSILARYRSAFKSDNLFDHFSYSDEPDNSFIQSTFDSDSCTNDD